MTEMPGTAIGLDPRDYTQHYRGKPLQEHVINVGNYPIKVTTRTVLLSGHCRETNITGISVVPSASYLMPGHSETFTVTVPSATGDYGIVFDAVPVTAHGEIAGVGTGAQVLTGHAVPCAPPVTHPRALSQASSGGFPVVWVIIAALAVAFAALAVWGMVLRHRRNARHT